MIKSDSSLWDPQSLGRKGTTTFSRKGDVSLFGDLEIVDYLTPALDFPKSHM